MSVQTFLCRLFGGRDVGVIYDNGAGTLTVLGQSITLSTLPAALQTQWQSAISGASTTFSPAGALRPAFGGDNVSRIVGEIFDNQPAWRNAVAAVLATYVDASEALTP